MRQNHQLLIGAVAFLGLCLGLGGALWLDHSRQPSAQIMQQPALARPAFTLPDVTGVQRDASEWAGQILILNFWATWCPPCREEIPLFVELQSEWQAQGIQFVGVAIDEGDAVQRFVADNQVNYPVLMAWQDGADLSRRYGNRVGALPYTVIFDRSGRIVHRQMGPIHRAQLQQILEPLLKDKFT